MPPAELEQQFVAEVDLDDTVALGGLDVIDAKPAERDRRPRWVQTSLGHQVTDGKVRRVTQSSQVGSLPALLAAPPCRGSCGRRET